MILDQLFCYCSFEDGKKTSDMVKKYYQIERTEMRKVDELRNVIANQFACEYKTYDFGEICNAFIDDLIRLMENSIKNEQGNFQLT